MLRRLLYAIVTLPAAGAMVFFALANRHDVTVSFDPFDPANSAYSRSVPLYLLGFALLLAGVLLGGFAAWLRQGRPRRTLAKLVAELRATRAELDEIKRVTRFGLLSPVSRRPPAA